MAVTAQETNITRLLAMNDGAGKLRTLAKQDEAAARVIARKVFEAQLTNEYEISRELRSASGEILGVGWETLREFARYTRHLLSYHSNDDPGAHYGGVAEYDRGLWAALYEALDDFNLGWVKEFMDRYRSRGAFSSYEENKALHYNAAAVAKSMNLDLQKAALGSFLVEMGAACTANTLHALGADAREITGIFLSLGAGYDTVTRAIFYAESYRINDLRLGSREDLKNLGLKEGTEMVEIVKILTERGASRDEVASAIIEGIAYKNRGYGWKGLREFLHAEGIADYDIGKALREGAGCSYIQLVEYLTQFEPATSDHEMMGILRRLGASYDESAVAFRKNKFGLKRIGSAMREATNATLREIGKALIKATQGDIYLGVSPYGWDRPQEIIETLREMGAEWGEIGSIMVGSRFTFTGYVDFEINTVETLTKALNLAGANEAEIEKALIGGGLKEEPKPVRVTFEDALSALERI